MKTNIIYIFNRNEIGGATKSMLSLIEFSCKKNNIIVLTPKKGKVYNYCVEHGIKVFRVPYFPLILSNSNSIVKSFFRHALIPLLVIYHYLMNYIGYFYLKSRCKLSDFDIIHSNIIRDDFGCFLSKKTHITHVMHLREFGKIDYKYIPLKRNYLKYINKYTNYYIAISDSIKKHYISEGLKKEKIVRIYNGVDVNKIKAKTTNFLENNILKIIFTGGIIDNKGQLELIKAISLLEKKYQRRIIVDMYGYADKKYLNEIKRYIKEKNVKSIISFKGYTNNINDVLREYDIGMMCSKSEAFGRTTIEYMAAGLIVCASNSGANCELIDDGISGFIYDYNNIESLTKIIKNILENKIDLLKISEKSKEYSSTFFSAQLNATNIFNFYGNILGGEKGE